jgi:hypothetical protein
MLTIQHKLGPTGVYRYRPRQGGRGAILLKIIIWGLESAHSTSGLFLGMSPILFRI